ncbi:DUF2922 domain-containing protein [Bacillus sp. Bva_UNVM-123]|uniref:DUF2922 domain-containing protein n=1 Tax=Bacillus sp. Bva_UNVM-123 TaxID=2829798 RepID=UPI00391F6C27
MEKLLELTFLTDLGKQSRISIDNPKEPIEPNDVKLAMEQIIAANIFQSSNGTLVAVKGVRAIERNVTEYEIL